MDSVQGALANVSPADLDGTCESWGGSSPVTHDANNASAVTPEVLLPRRTKTVFLYSDEDESVEEGKNDDACPRATTQNRAAEVICDGDAISVSDEVLSEMREEAAQLSMSTSHASPLRPGAAGDGDDKPCLFQEDVVSGLNVVAALRQKGTGMRVKEVAAPGIWEGVSGSTPDGNLRGAHDPLSSEPEIPALLRRGLPATMFVLQSRRKRFRAESLPRAASPSTYASDAPRVPPTAIFSGEPLGDQVLSPATASAEPSDQACGTEQEPPACLPMPSPNGVNKAGGEEDDSDTEEVEVEEELDVYPIYDDDGQTVRALHTRGGYRLTLDERDLLEDATTNDANIDGDTVGHLEAEEVDAGRNGERCCVDATDAMERVADMAPDETAEVKMDAGERDDAHVPTDPPEEGDNDVKDAMNGTDFDDEEDDEEEEELDEALIVAVVEQLVQCCEADDLDPQMSIEAARFLAAAKPLLELLTSGGIAVKDFVARVDRDLRRFQRIYRSVYRPRDAPIVVDGVVLDM